MIELLRTKTAYKSYSKEVSVVLVEPNDRPPVFGGAVGVDTETELITDTMPDPPLVVLGIFDPEKAVCYICYWQEAPMMMRALNASNTRQYYFNVGFDEMVLDNEDEQKTLLDALDANRVYDMQIRTHLACIADPNLGYIPANRYTLEQCVRHYEHVALDKGDGSDDSHRMTFRRYKPDGQLARITRKQAEYLAHDCISTWCLGQSVPVSPIDGELGVPLELAHVKGMVVLAHISRTGCIVDRKVYDALLAKLRKAMDGFRDTLLAEGFPDPYKDGKRDRQMVMDSYARSIERIAEHAGMPSPEPKEPSKAQVRSMMVALYTDSDLGVFSKHALEILATDNIKVDKVYDELRESKEGLAPIDFSTKRIALLALLTRMLELRLEDGFDFDTALAQAREKGEYWLDMSEPIGPKKFFQNRVKAIVSAHPDLHLSTTQKSGELQLTKKDMWRLQDRGIKDDFLEAYTGFKHCEKLISTYLNPEYIKADGKVHPRFHNIKRTGRTSCVKPNMQNLPARDHEYPMRNMYKAPDGAILCATDFSFVELVALSESCIRRFGHSTLGAIINAGVDPHRWFAGVRDGIITSDLSFTSDPDKIKEMNAYLKEHVSKEARQAAKAAKSELALHGVIHVEEESELLESA